MIVAGFVLAAAIVLAGRYLSKASSLKLESGLSEKVTVTENWAFQWRMLLLAIGTIVDKFSANKTDGGMSEDDYDKQVLYCILYSCYAKAGTVKDSTGKDYEFTFNTWGFYLQSTISAHPKLELDADPQRMGKIAYLTHFNNDLIKKYIAGKNGKVRIIELGAGTGAGANLVSKTIDCEAFYTVEMQKAAFETTHRKYCPTNPKLRPIHSNILDLDLEEASFDIVLINETHIAEMEFVTKEDKAVFAMVAKLLKPGGFFLWGNCVRDCVWDLCTKVITEGNGMELLKSTDYTNEAIRARDMDAERVDLYWKQLASKIWLTQLPVIGTKFVQECGLLLKNFYRHPGTELYKTMTASPRIDSYKQLIFQKKGPARQS